MGRKKKFEKGSSGSIISKLRDEIICIIKHEWLTFLESFSRYRRSAERQKYVINRKL